MNLTERSEIRKETFYKLTNSRDVPEAPSVGGRNLFKGSRDFSGTNWVGGTGVYAEDYQGVKIFKKNSMWSGRSQYFEVKAGEEYVFSAYVKSSAKTDRVTFFLVNSSKEPQAQGSVSFGSANGRDAVSLDFTDEYQRIAIKIKITKDGWIMPRIERFNNDAYLFFGGYKFEKGSESTPYSQAPEDFGWTMQAPVPTPDQRYLWKFEYIYYSDGNFEVTEPVNISIAGEDGKNSYIHTAYANITKLCNENQNFTVKASTVVRYGYGDKWVYKTFEAGTYAGNSATFGKDPYQGKVKQCDAITDFSLTDSTGRNWLGTYSDNSVNAVAHPSFFTWQLTKGQTGATGPQGIPGPPGEQGADGRTQYTHIAYADDATGSGFSQSSQGKTYIGMYQDFNPTNSSDPTKYRWSKWKGDEGAPGKPGADGKTSYFHMAYADSADGRTGFSFKESGQQYQGYYTDFTQSSSTDPTKYTWMDRRAGVKVGGRNLLVKTNQGTTNWDWSLANGDKSVEEVNIDGVRAVKLIKGTTTANTSWNYIQYKGLLRKLIQPNTQYVLSFDVKPSVDVSFYAMLMIGDAQALLTDSVRMNKALANQWTKVSCVLTSKTTLSDDLSQVVYLQGMPTANGNWLIIKNIKLEEGNTPTPWSPALEDTQDQIDSKADQTLTQEQLNALEAKRLQMETEMKALATLQQVSELETFINNLKKEDLDGRQKIIEITKAIEERVKDIEPIMEYSQKLKFMDTYITQGNGGMVIGANESTTKVVVTPDRISFQSGGSEVAYISQRMLHIDNGVFTMSLQLGHYITRAHPRNEYVNATYFVK